MNYKLILARFNEDIAWIKSLHSVVDNVVIMNKGDSIEDPSLSSKIIHLQNTPKHGREADCYLTYIIDNYSDLPDYVFFSQADPFEHSPDFKDLIQFLIQNPSHAKPYQPLTCFWKSYRGIPPLWNIDYNKINNIDKFQIYVEQLDDTLMPTGYSDPGASLKLSQFRRYHKIYNEKDTLLYIYDRLKLYNKNPYIGYILFNYGAIFGVKRQNILSNSLEYYKFIKEFLYEHPTHVYILERLWYTLFN